MSQGKRWCFTINNPTPADFIFITAIQQSTDYGIIGQEVGSNGTPHLQGYLVFPTNKRMAAVKKVHCKAHWELAKGTSESNKAYCSKEQNFQEWGICPGAESEAGGQGTAAIWDTARTAASEGRFQDIPSCIYIKHLSSFHRIHLMMSVRPPDLPLGYLPGVWIVGKPGTGKSRVVRDTLTPNYTKNMNKWWDNYKGEDTVLLEDFDRACVPAFSHLLKIWGDRYAFLGEYKNGSFYIRPKYFIITSNYTMAELFEDNMIREAIERRFTTIQWEERYMRDVPKYFLSKLPQFPADPGLPDLDTNIILE